jgi:glycosyltransferase involved in cell wall biosynthesis
MDNKPEYFEEVTLLVTHYNRSKSLERLLEGLKSAGCNFYHIVVSDDCSAPVHVEYLKELQYTYHFNLISGPAPANAGAYYNSVIA